jgi:cell division protein FtsL
MPTAGKFKAKTPGSKSATKRIKQEATELTKREKALVMAFAALRLRVSTSLR